MDDSRDLVVVLFCLGVTTAACLVLLFPLFLTASPLCMIFERFDPLVFVVTAFFGVTVLYVFPKVGSVFASAGFWGAGARIR